jgi:hypothetical protein
MRCQLGRTGSENHSLGDKSGCRGEWQTKQEPALSKSLVAAVHRPSGKNEVSDEENQAVIKRKTEGGFTLRTGSPCPGIVSVCKVKPTQWAGEGAS